MKRFGDWEAVLRKKIREDLVMRFEHANHADAKDKQRIFGRTAAAIGKIFPSCSQYAGKRELRCFKERKAGWRHLFDSSHILKRAMRHPIIICSHSPTISPLSLLRRLVIRKPNSLNGLKLKFFSPFPS